MIVHHEPGTTRDAIDTEMLYKDKRIVLIDTAGLRKRSHVRRTWNTIQSQAIQSIERCDICVLVVDVKTRSAYRIFGLSKDPGVRKGMLLAWNKWDTVRRTIRL